MISQRPSRASGVGLLLTLIYSHEQSPNFFFPLPKTDAPAAAWPAACNPLSQDDRRRGNGASRCCLAALQGEGAGEWLGFRTVLAPAPGPGWPDLLQCPRPVIRASLSCTSQGAGVVEREAPLSLFLPPLQPATVHGRVQCFQPWYRTRAIRRWNPCPRVPSPLLEPA